MQVPQVVVGSVTLMWDPAGRSLVRSAQEEAASSGGAPRAKQYRCARAARPFDNHIAVLCAQHWASPRLCSQKALSCPVQSRALASLARCVSVRVRLSHVVCSGTWTRRCTARSPTSTARPGAGPRACTSRSTCTARCCACRSAPRPALAAKARPCSRLRARVRHLRQHAQARLRLALASRVARNHLPRSRAVPGLEHRHAARGAAGAGAVAPGRGAVAALLPQAAGTAGGQGLRTASRRTFVHTVCLCFRCLHCLHCLRRSASGASTRRRPPTPATRPCRLRRRRPSSSQLPGSFAPPSRRRSPGTPSGRVTPLAGSGAARRAAGTARRRRREAATAAAKEVRHLPFR